MGDSVYNVIATGVLTKSYTATGLTLGVTYEFVVEARNSIGYSAISESLTILHAIPPETPDAPITTNSGQDIVVSWSAPIENGSPITSY